MDNIYLPFKKRRKKHSAFSCAIAHPHKTPENGIQISGLLVYGMKLSCITETSIPVPLLLLDVARGRLLR